MMIDWDSRFWSKVHPEAISGCWLWHSTLCRNGYGKFHVGARMVQAHRHAYELTRGQIQHGMVVRHKCDVTSCVNSDHLELGTQADNVRDMIDRGRAARGEAQARRGEINGGAKLSPSQVHEIRAKYATGAWTQRALARDYGVSQTLVSSIVRGANWPHLEVRCDR